jgi:hypothetical protein
MGGAGGGAGGDGGLVKLQDELSLKQGIQPASLGLQ